MKHVVQSLVLLVVAAVPAYAGVVTMTPIPEPATIGLVATAIGVVGGMAWWRRRKR